MNINYETIKKYLEENKTKAKIIAAILIVLLSLIYYKTGLNSDEIEVSSQSAESYSAEITEPETAGETPKTEDNTAVSYHSAEAYVDISGEVRRPGVYKVTTSTRLFEVIELAGGLTENADYNSLNQAETVHDGEKVIVPHIDADKIYEAGVRDSGTANAASSVSPYAAETGMININTADEALLQTLPGIGPVKSRSIIDYRNKNGKFSSIDELKKVNGIGKKTFETIKDLIVS